MDKVIAEYIKHLEDNGFICPDCMTCTREFYPEIKKGKNFSYIHAPSHKAKDRCESGKRNHCTCDTCF